MATPNGTQFQVASDAAFTNKLIDYSGAYKTSHATAAGVLTKGIPLYSRVRHSSAETGYSAWSATRQFSVVSYSQSILYISSVLPTDDNMFEFEHRAYTGGYSILVGSYMLVKLALDNKTIVWKKTGAGANYYFANICTDENDNIYALTMYYGGVDVYKSSLLKLDSNGNKIWERIFPNNAGGYDFTMRYRSGYVYFCGAIHRRNTIIGKISVSGDTAFLKYTSYTNDVSCGKLLLDSNGDIIVGGSLKPFNNSDATIAYLSKYSSSGTLLWGKSYSYGWTPSHYGMMRVMDMVLDNSDNIYFCGYLGDQYQTPVLLKVSSIDGSVIWKNQLGNSAWLHSLIFTIDGYLMGYGYNYRLVKFNTDGAVIWEKTATIANHTYLLYSKMVQYPSGELRLNMIGYVGTQYQNFFHCVRTDAYGLNGAIPSLSTISWATTTQTIPSAATVLTKYDFSVDPASISWGSMLIPTASDITFPLFDAPALTFTSVVY